MIPASEYNPSTYGDDQPIVHLKAVSGNEYRAVYDEDAGYFFADNIIRVRDINTLADGVPGRVYEPLDTVKIWINPGEPVTIRQILNAPAIRVDDDPSYEGGC